MDCLAMTNALPVPAAGSALADAPPASAVGFFERRAPALLILASFLFVTLPVAGLLVWTNSHNLLFLYIWIFSATHFVVTFTIYLQSQNLRHFTATTRNLILFVLIPFGIFAIFDLVRAMRVEPRFPMFAIAFAAAVRILDFNHFNRQSFGVYQLFKARTGLRLAAAAKRTESIYFMSLSVMLFLTYLSGGMSPWISRGSLKAIGGMSFADPMVAPGFLRAAALVCTCISAALLASVLTMLLKAWRAGGRQPGLWQSVTYLVFQTLSAVLAIAFLPLYATALAIHYAEYHVLMYPRCFQSRLDPGRRIDRWYQSFRGSQVLFYAVIVFVAGLVTFTTTRSAAWEGAASQRNIPYLAIIAIFDGIFVVHYFVEMLIWKFSDPFFRKTAGSLYFAPLNK
jgi:hypothetical protein